MAIELCKDGDPVERKYWPAMSSVFPQYQEFWLLHAYPLRGEDGQIRADIDGRLELMALENYKCFVSASDAMSHLRDESHPQDVFSSLQNAANRAQHVIKHFDDIRTDCLKRNEKADSQALRAYAGGLALYRNYVHEGVMGVLKRDGKLMMPKADKLKAYEQWSKLRQAPDADLVPILDEVKTSFDALIALLNFHWDQMLKASEEVLRSPRYAELLPPSKKAQHVPAGSPVVVGLIRIVASSNTQIG